MSMATRRKIVPMRKPSIATIVADDGLTDLEAELLYNIRVGSKILPKPIPHFEFALQYGRKYEADFAYPDLMILIECEGGVYTHMNGTFITKDGRTVAKKSRHLTAKGMTEDCEKYNLASVLGYKLLRFTVSQIHSGRALEQIEIAYLQAMQYDDLIETAIKNSWARTKKVTPIRAISHRPMGDAS